MASSPAGKLIGWLVTAAIAVAVIILAATVLHDKAPKEPLPTRVQCAPKPATLAKDYCQVLSKDGVWVISVKNGVMVATKTH